MTNPPERRTVQVSADVHARLFELADTLGTSAEGVIRRLVDPSAVHIPCTATQRQRWQFAADATGMRIEDWAGLQVERVLQGLDTKTLDQIFYRVDMLCQQAGLTPASIKRMRAQNQEE